MTQPVDRERAALQAILDALLPQLLYFCVWTYRVTATDGTGPVTISAKSQDARLPDQQRIVLRPGPDGGYSTPPVGSEIAIGFLNGDPERPYVHSLDPTERSVKSWLRPTTQSTIESARSDIISPDVRVGPATPDGNSVFTTSIVGGTGAAVIPDNDVTLTADQSAVVVLAMSGLATLPRTLTLTREPKAGSFLFVKNTVAPSSMNLAFSSGAPFSIPTAKNAIVWGTGSGADGILIT